MHVLPLRAATAVAALALCVSALPATESIAHSRRSPIVTAVKKSQPAVVKITIARPGANDLIGSGVLIDPRGYLVTNRHVVGDYRQVSVRLHDGTRLVGEVVFADSRWDLAVVRVNAGKALPALNLASTDDLEVGETVIALGHPYGYTDTVSTGIVSALGREITMPSGDTITGLIQTDASINPGNSGGALINIDGELIGINVALREGARGIAFALNANTVKTVLGHHLRGLRLAGLEQGPTSAPTTAAARTADQVAIPASR